MILIVAEHRDGGFTPVTQELVSLGLRMGQDLGVPVVAAVLGHEVGELARTLASWQVDRVIQIDDPAFSEGSPEPLTAAVETVIKNESPAFVIGGHTSDSMEVIPRVASRMKRPLIGGCLGYERHGDRVLFTRPVFNAKLHMRIVPRGEPPCFVTVAPGTFAGDALETGPGVEPESVAVDVSAVTVRRRRIGTGEAVRGEVALDAASVIVAVGRGIQKAENLSVVRELAEALGAPLGASRPVVDAGWLPRDRQIGSSGQTVAPRLYIAVGISGAIQHLVGMRGAQCIVAINKDGEAPVFKVAHYGIAADLFEVVPELTRLIRELRAGSAAAE